MSRSQFVYLAELYLVLRQFFAVAVFVMGSRKDKSVEEIYKKMTQLEHVIARPDTYVGSIQLQSEKMWVWSEEQEMMVNKQINFVPGLYKIFDEILVNAADNKQRDSRGMWVF